MLDIIIPDNNIPEREYIIKCLLSGFLGIQHNVIPRQGHLDYTICFNEKELNIKDCFFGFYPEPLSYLESICLPKQINYIKNDFITEEDIPIIYGTNELFTTEGKVICGVDIFASSFFMLTRWEEFVCEKKDEHLRFPGTESTAFKNGFLNRPVVNEYVDLLWRLLRKIGYNDKNREHHDYELVLTHDIDHLDYPGTCRIISGDILKRKDLKLAHDHLRQYIKSGTNPYDTFDFLMTNSEKRGLKSHFYFMSADTKLPQDPSFYLESKRFKLKIEEIKRRGHVIGFHPGYSTFNDCKRWSTEKQLLEQATKTEINEGRQHYLRFDIPKTFRILDENDMKIDSTLGYPDHEGFRCGTGDIFPVFDFLQRHQLQVKERPLIIMDTTLRRYKEYNKQQIMTLFNHFVSVGKKYNSKITMLFHNSSLYGEWEDYKSLYSELLSIS